jgi:hypothetical protein
VPAPSLQPTPCSTAIARQGPTTCHIANYGVQLRFKWETIVSGNSGGVAAQATFQYDVEFPVVPPARGALSAQRSRENREHSPAARRMQGGGRVCRFGQLHMQSRFDHSGDGARVPSSKTSSPAIGVSPGDHRRAECRTSSAMVRDISAGEAELEDRASRGLLRRSEHAGHRRTGPGSRDARDPKPVALIERHRPRVGRLKECWAVIGVDADQTLPE